MAAMSAPFMPIPPPAGGDLGSHVGYDVGFMNDFRETDAVDLDHFPMEQDESNKNQMKIPDALDAIAKIGKALWFDENTQYYHVLDGPLFEKEFSALRITRGKKKDNGQCRPFASMSRQYQMVQGEKWAATGTVFKMKASQVAAKQQQQQQQMMAEDQSGSSHVGSPDHYSQTHSSPTNDAPSRTDWDNSIPSRVGSGFEQTIAADSVMVQVRDKDGYFDTCTLQKFLEVTGIDELYRRSLMEQDAGNKRPRPDGGPEIAEIDVRRGLFGMTTGLPDSTPPPDGNGAMRRADVEVVVSNLWSATSRGDQAYFFRRKAGMKPFDNGSIVKLVGGELEADVGQEDRKGMYMVVSDLNAKWKGEPIPTADEERLGHWCCFLGQVPITVSGPVKCGDHIGPKGDGSGFGKVKNSAEGAVVGIALADKTSNATGVVKTLCFAGLGALTQQSGDQYKDILSRMLNNELKLTQLEGSVQEVKQQVKAVKVDAEEHREQVISLKDRVSNVEQLMLAGQLKELNKELRAGERMAPEVKTEAMPQPVGHVAIEEKYNGVMSWDTFSHGGKNLKLIAGGCLCCVLVAVAILVGVLIGVQSGGGGGGGATTHVTPSVVNNNDGSVGAGNDFGDSNDYNVEIPGVTWELEVDVKLYGVASNEFLAEKGEFLKEVERVFHLDDAGKAAKVTNTQEYDVTTRRLQTAKELQSPTSRRLLEVVTEVEVEFYAYTDPADLEEVITTINHEQSKFFEKLQEKVFPSLTRVDMSRFEKTKDGSSGGSSSNGCCNNNGGGN